MKQVNVINLDDPVGKTVGRRTSSDPLCTQDLHESSAPANCGRQCRQAYIPKGVFRFKSHEEADLWRRNSNTRARKG